MIRCVSSVCVGAKSYLSWMSEVFVYLVYVYCTLVVGLLRMVALLVQWDWLSVDWVLRINTWTENPNNATFPAMSSQNCQKV